MAPPVGSSPRILCGDTPLEEVRVSVEGLTGSARAAGLAAAEAVRGARTLSSLDQLLRSSAVAEVNDAAMRKGSALNVEVSPGPTKGVVDVALRAAPPAPGTWSFTWQAGSEERLDTALNVQVEHAASVAENVAPVRFGVGGNVNFGSQAVTGTLRIQPPSIAAWRLRPSLEIGMGDANLLGYLPQQQMLFGAFSLLDASGRHALRLQAAHQEYRSAPAQLKQSQDLGSTKASIGYRFLSDTRFSAGSGELAPGDLHTASVEVAPGGLVGDVAFVRMQALWTRSRCLWGGLFSLTAAAGVAVPLADDRHIPLEDRFFLGGTEGLGPGERMPGFGMRGLGPVEQRSAAPVASGSEPQANGPVKRYFFDKFFRSQSREASAAEYRSETLQLETPIEECTGGAARATLTATWLTPLPSIAGLRLRGMVTGTAGGLAEEVRPTLVADLAQQARASVAAGVMTEFRGGLLGVSFAQPLLYQDGDKRRGLQFWLSFGQSL